MRLLRKLFPRRTPPPPPSQPSAEDWQPGDLAECVVGGDWRSARDPGDTGPGPTTGEIRLVVDVVPAPFGAGLVFARWPRVAFNATQFRRLRPRAGEALRAEAGSLPFLEGRFRAPEHEKEPAL